MTGVDKNKESLDKAALMFKVQEADGIQLFNMKVEDLNPENKYDLVLCYGLLYHTENPMGMLRKLSGLCRKTLIIETQIFPFDITGSIEDGSYQWLRPVHGMFALCKDYSHSPEGGVTDIAIVPSRGAIEYSLRQFEFKSLSIFSPKKDDFEQFVRGHRIIITAER